MQQEVTSNTTPAPMKWNLVAGIKLHWCGWDNEYVLFNSTSGNTHQFDFITTQIVKLFEHSAASLDNHTIQQKVLEMYSLDEDISTRINQILSHLKKIDIIENTQ